MPVNTETARLSDFRRAESFGIAGVWVLRVPYGGLSQRWGCHFGRWHVATRLPKQARCVGVLGSELPKGEFAFEEGDCLAQVLGDEGEGNEGPVSIPATNASAFRPAFAPKYPREHSGPFSPPTPSWALVRPTTQDSGRRRMRTRTGECAKVASTRCLPER